MPRILVTINRVDVRLDLPPDLAPSVTMEDLQEMCLSAINHRQSGLGIQAIVKGVAQWSDMRQDRYEESDAIFADAFVDGPPWKDDLEISECDDDFTTIIKQNPDLLD